MRVVDTSLWIEYLADGALADQAEKSIEPLETCVVPAMVVYELAKWSRRNFSTDKVESVLSLLSSCHVVAMDEKIAVEAALLSAQLKLHATDAIIYATAQLLDAKLFTCDAHFKGLPGGEYFENKPGDELNAAAP